MIAFIAMPGLVTFDGLSTEEVIRARGLAVSFGGRFVRARAGYVLTPFNVKRYEQFLKAGATAVRSYRAGPGWRYRLANRRGTLSAYEAMAAIK